eukprot:6189050-Prorocentrum_lima.AAC.1
MYSMLVTAGGKGGGGGAGGPEPTLRVPQPTYALCTTETLSSENEGAYASTSAATKGMMIAH